MFFFLLAGPYELFAKFLKTLDPVENAHIRKEFLWQNAGLAPLEMAIENKDEYAAFLGVLSDSEKNLHINNILFPLMLRLNNKNTPNITKFIELVPPEFFQILEYEKKVLFFEAVYRLGRNDEKIFSKFLESAPNALFQLLQVEQGLIIHFCDNMCDMARRLTTAFPEDQAIALKIRKFLYRQLMHSGIFGSALKDGGAYLFSNIERDLFENVPLIDDSEKSIDALKILQLSASLDVLTPKLLENFVKKILKNATQDFRQFSNFFERLNIELMQVSDKYRAMAEEVLCIDLIYRDPEEMPRNLSLADTYNFLNKELPERTKQNLPRIFRKKLENNENIFDLALFADIADHEEYREIAERKITDLILRGRFSEDRDQKEITCKYPHNKNLQCIEFLLHFVDEIEPDLKMRLGTLILKGIKKNNLFSAKQKTDIARMILSSDSVSLYCEDLHGWAENQMKDFEAFQTTMLAKKLMQRSDSASVKEAAEMGIWGSEVAGYLGSAPTNQVKNQVIENALNKPPITREALEDQLVEKCLHDLCSNTPILLQLKTLIHTAGDRVSERISGMALSEIPNWPSIYEVAEDMAEQYLRSRRITSAEAFRNRISPTFLENQDAQIEDLVRAGAHNAKQELMTETANEIRRKLHELVFQPAASNLEIFFTNELCQICFGSEKRIKEGLGKCLKELLPIGHILSSHEEVMMPVYLFVSFINDIKVENILSDESIISFKEFLGNDRFAEPIIQQSKELLKSFLSTQIEKIKEGMCFGGMPLDPETRVIAAHFVDTVKEMRQQMDDYETNGNRGEENLINKRYAQLIASLNRGVNQ